MIDTAKQYFSDNPEAKSDVLKAFYAFHSGEHSFVGIDRYKSPCSRCGRTRDNVRYDDLPGQCERIEVADAILKEEEKAHALHDRAGSIVEKFFSRNPVTGANLAKLKQTHGIGPDFACDLLGVPFSVHEFAFLEEENRHSEKGREGYKPEVITCKT